METFFSLYIHFDYKILHVQGALLIAVSLHRSDEKCPDANIEQNLFCFVVCLSALGAKATRGLSELTFRLGPSLLFNGPQCCHQEYLICTSQDADRFAWK